jgi:subtilisin family serine protease
MRRPLATLLVALFVAGAAAAPVVAQGRGGFARAQVPQASAVAQRPLPPWVEGRVLVEWRRGVSRGRVLRWLGGRSAAVTARIGGFGIDVVRLPGGVSVTDAVARFSSSPLVRTVEPDFLLQPLEVPNDPRFRRQWALRNRGQPHPVTREGSYPARPAQGRRGADMNVSWAWNVQRGSRRTVIAVLDSGVDTRHPDLRRRLWRNPREEPGDGRDNDRNGLVDDVFGWDFAENDASLVHRDPAVFGADHGTHVAGVAAATANNATGVAGGCPRCKVMVLKFMRPVDVDGDGTVEMSGTQSAELRALAYARRHGADIVNASFGGTQWSRLERRAFQRLGRAGVLSVVAAGNENGDNDLFMSLFRRRRLVSLSPLYPAAYGVPSILSVAASNHRDRYGYGTACARARSPHWPCSFSNWGHDSVDVAAPGVDIVGPVPGGGYDTFDGTSMSAPQVAGVAGLVASEHPRYSPARVKQAIMRSADRPAGLRRLFAFPRATIRGGGFTRTSGRVNARRALDARPRAFPPSDGTIAGARSLKRRLATGRVSWPRDANDVYRKRLRRGRYRVALNGRPRRNLDLAVYRPGTKDIWQFEIGCRPFGGRCSVVGYETSPGPREVMRFRVRRRGAFLFHVSAFLSRSRYSLRVRRL